MLINVPNEILMPLSYLFMLLLCLSTEDETWKDNNYPEIDIGKVDMACRRNAVGVNRAPIIINFIVGNKYYNGMFDGDGRYF